MFRLNARWISWPFRRPSISHSLQESQRRWSELPVEEAGSTFIVDGLCPVCDHRGLMVRREQAQQTRTTCPACGYAEQG